MPKSAVSLQIPQPCAESWAAMTPRGAGRHCASCQQVVIDFTQKTDAEILAIVGAAAGGSLCGRLTERQLNRPLLRPAGPRPGWWSTAVAATVALLAGRTLTAPPARAQAAHAQHPSFGRHSPGPAVAPVAPAPAAAPDSVRTQVSGRVVDESGQPLPGVTVLVQGTQHGTSTDAQGHFQLPLEPGEQQSGLAFHSIGFESRTLPLPPDGQTITLTMSERQLGGLMVVAPVYTPRGLWSRLRSIPYRVRRLWE